MLSISQLGPVEILSFKNSEYLDMKSSFCEKNEGVFSQAVFFFQIPREKKNRKIVLHRGRKEIVCDNQEKKKKTNDFAFEKSSVGGRTNKILGHP